MLAILLMVIDRRSNHFASVRSALSLTVAPIQYLVSMPTELIDTTKSIISSHSDLIAENKKLKEEELLLRAQLQRLLSTQYENNYLKMLHQSTKQTKNKTLIAELLAVDSVPFVNQVIINKGTRDGVYVNQPVLDAYGVMGQVIQTGPITSRVLLINDPHSGIAVQNVRNGQRAIAMGSYPDKLRLLYVAKTADIKVDDIFITSGLGDHYPEGYTVGTVEAVSKDPAHQFADVFLKPCAHLDNSRQILLVWYQNNG